MQVRQSMGALVCAAVVLCVMTPALAVDKVKMRLDWVFGTEHSGIFVALEKGFFRQEGNRCSSDAGRGFECHRQACWNG